MALFGTPRICDAIASATALDWRLDASFSSWRSFTIRVDILRDALAMKLSSEPALKSLMLRFSDKELSSAALDAAIAIFCVADRRGAPVCKASGRLKSRSAPEVGPVDGCSAKESSSEFCSVDEGASSRVSKLRGMEEEAIFTESRAFRRAGLCLMGSSGLMSSFDKSAVRGTE